MDTRILLDSMFRGRNLSVFACKRNIQEMYATAMSACLVLTLRLHFQTDGQSGSGKTYTMAGGYSEGNVRTRRLLPEKYGITPRAIRHIFKKDEFEAAATVEVSACSLYITKLRDLFRRLNIKEKEDKKTKQTD